METLKGKQVLIAGATGGIGAATARLLHNSGAIIYLAARNQHKLHQLGTKLGIPASRLFAFDITDVTSVSSMAAWLYGQTNSPDILINATGIGIIKPFENLNAEEFRLTLETNLTGTFLLLKALLPAMKKEGKGLIINIPGVLGKMPMAGAAAYAASKYGLTGMMQSIREELKRTQIRITNVFLGGVDSPFWDAIDLRVQRDKMIQTEEAARSIWFLCQQPDSGVVSELVLQPFNHQAI